MDDGRLDALLIEMLAPPEGQADAGFVSRVDKAVAEAELYSGWKRTLRNQLVTEALAILAIGGSLAFLAQAPAIRIALAGAPWLLSPAILSLFLLWMLVRSRPRLLA